jgi:23S rRNA pseudouridine955/2504/2580 synthase/23S rRNA pseudouridine1911/1915/1917 synthase
MRTETKQVTAPEDAQGARLDAWLAARFPVLSRNEWQQRIDGGHVTLNGRPARASRRLNFGDQVEFSYTMRAEPEVPTEIGIVYEDTDYLVVNKPPGLPVHPSGIYKTQTVTTLLVARNVLTEPYLLHRLDRETSGVLVLARNRRAAALFQKILRQGQIEKTYLVAVEGDFVSSLDAAGFIYRLPDSRLPRQRFFSPTMPPANALEVQHCRTLLKPVEHRSGISLVEATLLTGRMHQIRATMHSLGYPVIGDKLYGVDPTLYFTFADEEMTAADWQKLRIARSALHCNCMRLQHPVTGVDWTLEAPLPDDMAGLFRQ